MPPKARNAKSKLHVLAVALRPGTVITDTRKQNFIIENEFAQGGFGRIYSASLEGSRDYGKPGTLAVKVEPKGNGPLFTEIMVFQRILKVDMLKSWQKRNNVEHLGLPPHLGSGIFVYEREELRFLAMPKYSDSLEKYRSACGGKFDAHTGLIVARQCADCLAYMQDQDYVHADLKADNILLASPNNFSQCYLADFGLARMIKSNIDKPDKKRAHNGTLIFTSLDAHRGCCPSPRGDLEILAYNLLYWLSGTLPWQKDQNSPDLVYAGKKEFSEQFEERVKSMLRNNAVVSIIQMFRVSYETAYTEKINYDTIKKSLDTSLRFLKHPVRTVNKVDSESNTRRSSLRLKKQVDLEEKAVEEPQPCSSNTYDIAPSRVPTKKKTVKSSLIPSDKTSVSSLIETSSYGNLSRSRQSRNSYLKERKCDTVVSKKMLHPRTPSLSSEEPILKRRSVEKSSSESPDFTIKSVGRKQKKVLQFSDSEEEHKPEPTVHSVRDLKKKKNIKGRKSPLVASSALRAKNVNGDSKEEQKKNVVQRKSIVQTVVPDESLVSRSSCVSVAGNTLGSGSPALNSSRLTAGRSEISSIIPGVRNMKKIRRSLDARLVQKYKSGKK